MTLPVNNIYNDEIKATLNGLTKEVYKLHNICNNYELSSELTVQKLFRFKKKCKS